MVLVVASLVWASASRRAIAQTDAADPRCEEFGLDDAEVTARLHDVRARIERHEPDMRHWLTAFGVLHGAMLGAQIVLAATANSDGPRVESIVGSVSSLLGLGTLLVSFPPLVGAGGQIDAMPEDTPEQRVAKLVRAEELLRRSAEASSFVRGPVASLLSAGYVMASSAFIMLGFDRIAGGYTLMAGGIVLGQGRILLHPDGIIHEWRRYLHLHPDAGCTAPVNPGPQAGISSWTVAPVGVPAGAGLGLTLTF